MTDVMHNFELYQPASLEDAARIARRAGPWLDAHGLAEDTIVVFLSDNGGAANNASINRPLRDHKDSLFEGGLQPHHYCLPVLKRARHQEALQRGLA